jgi:replicative DNA helicase
MMSKSNYVDIPSLVNVIANVYKNPKLLGMEDKYTFSEYDFYDDFHQIIFGSIYNLYQLGVKEITINAIEDYLSGRPKKKAVYDNQKGAEFISKAIEYANENTFDYYYNRMKKFSLLRAYSTELHMDLTWLYDPDNIFDIKKKQQQEEWLDSSSLVDITRKIDDKIDKIKVETLNENLEEGVQAGEGLQDLINRLREVPEFGYPMYGPFINTVTRGARLGKFYLWSAGTGIGKSRTMIANAAHIGCSQMWDHVSQKWISIGEPQPVLYISTEQQLDEVQTMICCFIAGVDEEHILYGEYQEGEWERIIKANQIIKQSKMYISVLPDFSLQDVEDTIKREMREHQVNYVFFDYLHSSLKILEEVASRTSGMRLREDNVLFMLSARLKDLCIKHEIFILSATQLNGDYVTASSFDQNLLRGVFDALIYLILFITRVI